MLPPPTYDETKQPSSSTRRGMRRRRTSTQQSCSSRTSRLLPLTCAYLALAGVGGAAESSSSQCSDLLWSFDQSNDGLLSRTEYARVVTEISRDRLASDYAKLPWEFKEIFDDCARTACRSDRCINLEDDIVDNVICLNIEWAVQQAGFTTQQQPQQQRSGKTQTLPHYTLSAPTIVPPPEPAPFFFDYTDASSPNLDVALSVDSDLPHTTSRRFLELTQQCRVALSVGDRNRDDLLDQEEYVRYVNQLSRQQFRGATFSSLPQTLQQSYDGFATMQGQIPVAGSKPGQTPDDIQSTRLGDLCSETRDLIEDDPQPSPNPPSPPVRQPPTGEVDCTGTIGRPQCNTALAIADLSRDNLLNQVEYVRFVNRLSGNMFAGDSFADLPGNVQTNFNNLATSNGQIDISGSKPGQTPTDTQDIFLDELCCLTDLAISSPPPPTPPNPPTPPPNNGQPPTGGEVDCTGTISRLQCNTAIAIADISRNNLVDQTEYLRFINRLSGNGFAGVSFNDLPCNIVENYNKFATTGGQIDVNGAKPGQTPTDAQDIFLDALCCETDLVVEDPGDCEGPTPNPPTPTPPGSQPPTFLPILCQTAMASSDLNRDDSLSQVEYLRFLNRLTSNEFAGLAFSDLDPRLQDNYNNLATTNGEIGIFGSKPGQNGNAAQEEAIDNICLQTAFALAPEAPSEPTNPPAGQPSPTPAPIAGGPEPTLPPTFLDALCRTAVASSDFNRDDYLNKEEFIRVLNRLTRNEFINVAFDDLERPLPQVYNKLVSENGEIYVFGSKPGQNADQEQEDFIIEICLEISIALSRLGETDAPTTSPNSEPTDPGPTQPTFAPGTSEVFNSFIVTNVLNIQAESLQEDSRNREGLNRAYALFSETAINDLGDIVQRKSMLRKKRKLAVNHIQASPEIYLLIDSECPETLTGRGTCQTAFASFRVEIDDEDPLDTSDLYTEETQRLIIEGFLQAALDQVDPGSPLQIFNASWPVFSTLPPASSPAPTEAPDDGGSVFDLVKDLPVGAIAGGAAGGCLFFVLVGFLTTNERVKAMCNFRKRGKATGIPDDDDEYGGGDKDDDDASDDGNDKTFGLGNDGGGFGDNDNAFGDKQEKEKKKKFGKKNKQGSEKNLGDDNPFGFEPPPASTAFGDDKDDNQDFANYGFDEPSDAEGDKKDGSGREDEDNVFGDTPGSPGWGNTADGAGGFFGNAGGGWGTGDTNSAADNFFATSAFGEQPQSTDEVSGSESGSGSDSYTSSEDSTYESEEVEDETEGATERSGDDEESYSRSSADEEDASTESGSTPSSMGSALRHTSQELDTMIDDGNWDGVAKAANSFQVPEGSSLEGSSKRSDDKDSSLVDDDGTKSEGSYSGSSRSDSESGSGSQTTATTTTEMREKRVEFRAQVEALVRLVMPDEIEKVDKMMDQFQGREAELVSTLQTMQERSATQRARAAVHKSKTRPERADGQFRADGLMAATGGTEGSAAGTAAIAAASLPIPAATMMDGASQEGDVFGDGDTFGQDEGTYDDEEGSRSYYSGEDSRSGSRSYYSGEDSRSGSRSYYSGEEGSQSYISGEGSRSYRSGEGSQSYISGEGSYRSGSRSGSGSRSFRSGEGSQSYISGEGSQSYISGDAGSQSLTDRGSQSYITSETGSRSFISGETGSQSYETGSQSYVSGEGSRSYVSGEGSRSYISGEDSRSYRSGEESYHSGEGSYRSGEGSQSYISGEGSYRSGDGSRSYYSGEEGSQRSGSGSRSYYSGEEEGSYYSGEEGSYYSGEEE